MKLREWDKLPEFMRCSEVREYYDILAKKKNTLRVKRMFDIVMACILLMVLAIPMTIVAIMIKKDSPGPVFYRQERATTYGRRFRIHKFRTMVDNADQIGTHVTVDDDPRITKAGSKIRRLRIDELPQLLDVLKGDMTFVGTRPEAMKYVKEYTNEMNATLLLPAGITSEASIRFKDEDKMLKGMCHVDEAYVDQVLPIKMKWNLESIKSFSIMGDVLTMIRTIATIFGKDYS